MQITSILKHLLYSTLIASIIIGCGGGGGSPANPIVSTYTLTYTSGTGGSLTGNTNQTVNAGANGSTVTATADAGYRFMSWSDGSTVRERQDTGVQANISVRANFSKDQLATYQLHYKAQAHGAVFGDTRQTIAKGADAKVIKAIADAGYLFSGWDDNVTEAEREDKNIQSNQEIIANFTVDTSLSTHYVTMATDGSGDYNCDGTDDDIQINQALTEIANAGGGTVHLKAGTYTIASPIEISGDHSTLEGAGIEQTIIKLKDEAGWVTINSENQFVRSNKEYLLRNVIGAREHIIIRNFAIDGNKDNQHVTHPVSGEVSRVPDGQGFYDVIGLFPANGQGVVKNIHLDNIYVYEANSDAFIIHNAENIKVEHCKSINIGHSAIYALDPVYMMVEDNNFTINANSGVRWYDGNHIIVRNNHLQGDAEKTGNSNFAIEVTSGQTARILDDAVIEHNIMKYVAGAAIAIDAKTPAQATGMIIRNNSIYQCSAIGTWVTNRERGAINIKNFTNTLIENNSIINCIGGGIRLGGNAGFNDEWDEVQGLTATIRNNIIAHTILDRDKGIVVDAYGIDIGAGNSAECTYNNLWDNHSGNYNGCTPGIGSISEDPQFAYLELGTTFKNTHGRADLHLKSSIGRWNPTTQTWSTDTNDSTSINAGNPITDASQEEGQGSNRVNMGMYGNTPYASKGTQSPPVAESGLDQYLREDGNGIVYVGLDGSQSSDDGTIVSYIWKISGLQIADSIRATVPLSVGLHTIELTVTDNDGLSTRDTLLVRINPNGNYIDPMADAGEDQTLTSSSEAANATTRTILSSTASYDEDGTIVYYTWSENGTVLSTEANPALEFLVGVHDITLSITDNEGRTHTDSLTVTIKPKRDYALALNEGAIIDEYISIPNVVFSTDLTIEMWVKPLETSGDLDALITMGEDGQQLVLKNMQPGWGVDATARSSHAIPLGSWSHIAFVVKNDKLDALYVNGTVYALEGDGNITRPRGYMGVGTLYINTADTFNFKGVFDEIRVWDVARTAQEITDNKDRELNGKEPDLAAYFNFNDGSGNKIIDLTGTYSGTLSESMGAENWVEGAITPWP